MQCEEECMKPNGLCKKLTNEQKLMDIHNKVVVTKEKEVGGGRSGETGSDTLMEGNQTSGGDHTRVHRCQVTILYT